MTSENDHSAERMARIEALFHQALARRPQEREAYVMEACADDHDLRASVIRLLKADEGSEAFLAAPAGGAELLRPGAVESPPPSVGRRPGQQIGPYRLVRLIGTGGMGEVWLAERDDEHFSKSVAIKLLKHGLDTVEWLQRFRHERQVLANIEHPNIARLIDGGATDDGKPYLVMEYVDGTPIDRYCDEQGLSLRERLTIFRVVCDAVQHAHQNLVIHRDLKPANILVSADGNVKLLDFGIAKVLDDEPHDSGGDVTIAERRLLTPRYASPEQAKGVMMSTASDVYSLGVVLYELLTGRPPYPMAPSSARTVEQIICEEEPARPSTAIARASGEATTSSGSASGHQADAQAISRLRGLDPIQLRNALRGDLDTIILKALRKEPERRYASAEALSEDIRRHLEELPVIARPDTFGYRCAKFIRRNRVGVLAAVLVFAVTLCGFIVTSAMYVRAEAARQAEAAQRLTAQEVTNFLARMLASANPRLARGKDISLLRELVDDAALRIETELVDQPAARTKLAHILGQVYHAVGLYDEAEPLLTSSLAGYIEHFAADDPGVYLAEHNLAVLRQDQGRLDEARELFRSSLEGRRRVLGPTHADTLASLSNLANHFLLRRENEKAEKLLREALELRTETLGGTHPDTMVTLNDLANLLSATGRVAEAEQHLKALVRNQAAVLPPDHQDLLVSKNDLAMVYRRQDKLREAEALLRDVVDAFRRTIGDDHIDTLITMNNLARVIGESGRDEEAESMFRETVERAMRSQPDGSYFTAVFRGGYGKTLMRLERYELAERELRSSCDTLSESLGADHSYTQRFLPALVELYEITDQPEKAARDRSMIPVSE